MRTVAILPVKRFGVAKRRLRDGLDSETREALVQAMFTDVLESLGQVAVTQIVVVTASDAAAQIATQRGCLVLADEERGHSAAAELGIEAALQSGAERVLLIPGDCPALDPQEVDELLGQPAASPSVLIVPDRHGTGTNALLLTPPDALSPSFGPGSCQRHRALAEANGVDAQVVPIPSLALDIDTPDDIASLAAIPVERATLTRRLLAQPSRC